MASSTFSSTGAAFGASVFGASLRGAAFGAGDSCLRNFEATTATATATSAMTSTEPKTPFFFLPALSAFFRCLERTLSAFFFALFSISAVDFFS